MINPSDGVDTTGGLCFAVDAEVPDLPALKDYILTHATALPISATELLSARVVTIDEIDEDAFPDDNEFTPAEARFLGRIIDYCVKNPDRAEAVVSMDFDDGITDVAIEFPAHMEPPAELH